ncbi:MAG TPA: carboxypeptidase-like regulatory domain-containing protein [Pseudolysinimonas sp.]
MTQQSLRSRRPRLVHLVLSVTVALAAALLGAAPAHASASAIDGTVYDATSGSPVAGVTVIAVGPDDVPETDVTDALGEYSIVPAYGYGDYDISAGSDDYVWSPLAIAEPSRTITFDATLGTTDFTLDRGRALTGIVRDALDGTTPLAGIVVGATNATGDTYFDREAAQFIPGAPFGATAGDGLFRITVPLDDDYEVVAIDFTSDYDPQGYDHVSLSGCGCDLDLITVGTTWGAGTGPVPNIDFDLRRYSDWTYVSVLTQRPGPIAYPGVLVHLDRYDSGTSTWTLDVDSATSDGSGYADLYGLGSGDYRLRYSISGVFKSVLVAEDPSSTPYPTSDGGKVVDLPGLTAGAGCGCGFDETDVNLTFAAPSGGGSGGGTPTTPRKPHTAVTTFASITPTPTPTPTPTSTPTPTASPSASDEATPSPQPTSPATTTTGLDLTWLWIVLGIVAALIIAFFVIMLLRARRP